MLQKNILKGILFKLTHMTHIKMKMMVYLCNTGVCVYAKGGGSKNGEEGHQRAHQLAVHHQQPETPEQPDKPAEFPAHLKRKFGNHLIGLWYGMMVKVVYFKNVIKLRIHILTLFPIKGMIIDYSVSASSLFPWTRCLANSLA